MTLTRSQYALAASLAALVVAAPAAFVVLRSGVLLDVEYHAFKEPDAPVAARDYGRREPHGTGDAKQAEQSQDRPLAAAQPVETEARKSEDAKPAIAANEPAKPATGRLDEGTTIATAPPPPPTLALPADGLKAKKDITGLVAPGAVREAFERNRATAAPSSAPVAQGYAGLGSADKRQQAIGGEIADADAVAAQPQQEFRDKFEAKEQSPVKQTAAEPVSTFSIDVDTASYSFVRRNLNAGQLPPKASVRVEEMINYFPYAYPKPDSTETPFKPTVTVLPAPWNAAHQLVHIGIKGYDIQSAERPRANLVFLIDISGSMESTDKLPLVKQAFRMLVDELKPDDTVGIVTYASGSGVLLEPTKISDKRKILAAIDKLGAGGSTAGAEGIQDAYRLAEETFDAQGVNRIVLATDGDFNVGVTDQNDLKGLIERKREKGIFLSILGVGQGNYNDALMQTLAQNGNGTAAYVDTLNEARKVLVDEASSTLFTIAKDVKIQVEWNPARVAEYRLIGYETRALRREDFNNDRIDAGDIGSGHTVTAIYEITPKGSQARLVDDLRYGKASGEAAAPAPAVEGKDGELGFLKLRYKLPKEDASKLITQPITLMLGEDKAAPAMAEARFSVAVAGFGELLRGSPYVKDFNYDDVVRLARDAKGDDPFGYRAEFLNLVRLAKSARP